ncbi:MAG: glycosyltransferase, partial [Candidatus Latescibacteria bacterium]|nr:glycosyltransferase [Candidatus Latescibacterota bacterium]
GVGDRVVFTGYRPDAARLMHALDLFVLPSWSEGLPVTILEAMASGKPVIATSVGGTPEVVVDGETGTLVPPGNPERLAEAILYHLEHPEVSRGMGEKGLERVRSGFSLKRMIDQTFRLYERVLS